MYTCAVHQIETNGLKVDECSQHIIAIIN